MPYFGELIALLTAFLWSGTSYAFTEASKRIGSLQLNINRMILAVIILFAIIGVFGFSIELSFRQFKFLVISGIAGLVLGDSFLFKSFQIIGARLGMLLMALVPGFSTLLALIFLDEILSIANLAGMAVTLTGISIVVMDRNEKSQTVFHLNKLGVFYVVLGALGQASGLILAIITSAPCSASPLAWISPIPPSSVRITSAVLPVRSNKFFVIFISPPYEI